MYVIVVNFFVKEENVLSGIQDYIEYIPLKTFISVSTSNYVDEDGFYLVYIEIRKQNFDVLFYCRSYQTFDVAIHDKHEKRSWKKC